MSGAYFKNDNGLWFIERSPGDPSWCGGSYSLMKLKRNGQPSTAKYNLCSWPIAIFTNSWVTRNEAHRWNEEHAEIEVVPDMDTSALAEHFMGLVNVPHAFDIPYILGVLRHKEARKFWASVAERLKK